jgi:hypothetical protein
MGDDAVLMTTQIAIQHCHVTASIDTYFLRRSVVAIPFARVDRFVVFAASKLSTSNPPDVR